MGESLLLFLSCVAGGERERGMCVCSCALAHMCRGLREDVGVRPVITFCLIPLKRGLSLTLGFALFSLPGWFLYPHCWDYVYAWIWLGFT